jgi:galactose oxidase-like protein/fibronectin type III domain protein
MLSNRTRPLVPRIALCCVALFATWSGFDDPALAQDLSVAGRWSAAQTWPTVSVHTHLLPTGKVFFYGYSDVAYFWDPATSAITPAATAGHNTFCTGHSFLADGRLFIAGGHISNNVGLSNASIYDSFTNAFTHLPNMNAGRWYPTSTTLANGDVLVVSGDIDNSQGVNTLPQVWRNGSGWRDLTGASLALPLYPFMYLAPNGKVFLAGQTQVTRYLDTTDTGAWSMVANSNFGHRSYGSSVMYDDGKVLILGGGDPPTATAEVIDLTASTPTWKSVASMANRRRQVNATLLPDGKVLVTGGSSGAGFDNSTAAVYAAELWDPATDGWTTVASYAKYRGYHSIALLLPDGRVLSAGGDGNPTAEVYSPGYLFKGPRPAISSAPTSIFYGQTFFLETADAARIGSVTLIRLSSVTHSFNMDQRINRLTFTSLLNGLVINAPSNANLTPPGYYMLFILDDSGVPSEAKMVRVDPALPTLPSAPADLAASGVSASQINLAWTDVSSNEDGFRVERCTGTGCTDFAQVAQVGTGATAYNSSGLAASTTYTYRVRAFNAAGDSAYSNIAQATTQAAPTVPAAPTNLIATTLSSSQIRLTWTDASTNESGFKIERCKGGGCITFVQIAQVGAGVTTYTNTGLSSGSKYRYRVRAFNSVGHSSYSSTAQATTSGAPAAPSNLAARLTAPREITLTWTDNSNESGFRIFSCRGTTCTPATQIAQVGANVTTYRHPNRLANTTYRYRVNAFNSSGTSSYSNIASAKTSP